MGKEKRSTSPFTLARFPRSYFWLPSRFPHVTMGGGGHNQGVGSGMVSLLPDSCFLILARWFLQSAGHVPRRTGKVGGRPRPTSLPRFAGVPRHLFAPPAGPRLPH